MSVRPPLPRIDFAKTPTQQTAENLRAQRAAAIERLDQAVKAVEAPRSIAAIQATQAAAGIGQLQLQAQAPSIINTLIPAEASQAQAAAKVRAQVFGDKADQLNSFFNQDGTLKAGQKEAFVAKVKEIAAEAEKSLAQIVAIADGVNDIAKIVETAKDVQANPQLNADEVAASKGLTGDAAQVAVHASTSLDTAKAGAVEAFAEGQLSRVLASIKNPTRETGRFIGLLQDEIGNKITANRAAVQATTTTSSAAAPVAKHPVLEPLQSLAAIKPADPTQAQAPSVEQLIVAQVNGQKEVVATAKQNVETAQKNTNTYNEVALLIKAPVQQDVAQIVKEDIAPKLAFALQGDTTVFQLPEGQTVKQVLETTDVGFVRVREAIDATLNPGSTPTPDQTKVLLTAMKAVADAELAHAQAQLATAEAGLAAIQTNTADQVSAFTPDQFAAVLAAKETAAELSNTASEAVTN